MPTTIVRQESGRRWLGNTTRLRRETLVGLRPGAKMAVHVSEAIGRLELEDGLSATKLNEKQQCRGFEVDVAPKTDSECWRWATCLPQSSAGAPLPIIERRAGAPPRRPRQLCRGVRPVAQRDDSPARPNQTFTGDGRVAVETETF